MDLSPKNIATAPFIPVTTEIYRLSTEELNPEINTQGAAVIIPSISAYIGADTVAAILSFGMRMHDETVSRFSSILALTQRWLLEIRTG